MTERDRAAIHEAGHGVVATLLDIPFVRLVVQELKDGVIAGAIQYGPDSVLERTTGWTDVPAQGLGPDDLVVSAAGIVAECLLCRAFTWRDVIGLGGDLLEL